MTSRLKRKLGDMGVDLSSRRATENFCLIGTPLPPLEKTKDTGEFVPLWKQEVRDDKGRRRLHGAFTGGFSAGYFNTVGSKEGWTPSTFVSSRSDRAKQAAAKPEDFMDEEDLRELNESRTLVSTAEPDSTASSSQPAGNMGLDNDPIATALASAQHKDSPGMKILKKMGWRPGQGIGTRVSLAERKRQDAQAFDPYTGVKSTESALDVGSDDEEASKHKYPRRDTPILSVSRKKKSYGLGYTPGLTLNESIGAESGQKGASGPKISSGFGLGALNDADEDDVDIYDSTAASKTRIAFDHLDHDQDDTIVIGKGKGRQINKPQGAKGPAQVFYDGTPVLPGFTLSDQPVQEDKWFPGPEVPPGWEPDPRKVWNASPSKEKPQPPTAPSGGRPQISAAERGTILGEESKTRSIFEFMSEKDRERIKRIAAGDVPPGPGAPVPPPPSSFTMPQVEPHIAKAALQGFQPFTTDPAKQARYTAFLHSQADSNAPPLTPLPGQDPEKFHKEVEDYAKAAILFKPMSGAMAGRFTSAVMLDVGPKVQEGLHKPTEEDYAKHEEEKRAEEEKNVPPKVHAARMGMYGPMTRETQSWQPAKLLCKRFGVKEPDLPVGEDAATGESSFSGMSFEKEAAEVAEGAPGTFNAPTGAPSTSDAVASSSNGPRKLENIGMGEDETQGADILTYERPSMDIFKAIFASDEEDSDEEGGGKDDEEQDDGDGEVGQTKSIMKQLKLQDTGPVDLATFKPTFIPREGKAKANGDDQRAKEKKDKKEKKKKDKKAGLVSFQLEEDGEPNLGNPTREKDRPKKKRKDKEKKREEDNDAGMFVDPPPEQVKAPKAPDITPVVEMSANVEAPRVPGPKGRKRAIDFLDE
ncbi:hypothetical protein EST38_g1032 [Candolleomyces aberdarensis]|uniref:G-patch domain-containing protein n=1 Tax=Candolleomyces aberdarensis TaxID=2316362 RepID=A0A4Q2DWH5_9AGAR|nr:hypothetical protein EST38_g1032 [Candolleomyces aberdarensis]